MVKIKAEINEIENRKIINTNDTKSWSLKCSIKLPNFKQYWFLKIEKIQITNIRNVTGDITTDLADIKGYNIILQITLYILINLQFRWYGPVPQKV